MENIGVGAGLAGLGFWLFIGLVVIAGIWDTARKREAQHETVRRIIESGQPVDPALIDKILVGDRNLDRDLKVSGLITLSAAPGLALLGLVLSLIAEKALMPLLGVSLLVGCVGAGLLIAGRYAKRWEENSATGRSGSSMA